MKTRNTILLIVCGLVLLIAVNYMLFTGMLGGFPKAVEQALESDGTLLISSTMTVLTMEPTTPANIGVLMYGEGKDDVRTYAPIARMMADAGVKVVIIGRRLQQNQPDDRHFLRIDEVIAADPNLTWYIGGHTSGAQLPVKYALSDLDQFEGIVLWAARLTEGSDLSSISLPVLYIYGDLDDANVSLLENHKRFLPDHTQFHIIKGANRADFAYWGPKAADVGSAIPIPEVQKQASELTIDFIQSN